MPRTPLSQFQLMRSLDIQNHKKNLVSIMKTCVTFSDLSNCLL